MSSLPSDQRLIVALDVPTIAQADELVRVLSPIVTTFKIGYWLLFDPGLHALISMLKAQNKNIFLDAKLNDIPETVKHGVASAASWGADFITVHSDEAMLEAAMDGKGSSSLKVMAVTALTSQHHTASRDRFRAGLANAIITSCDGLIMAPSDLTDRMRMIADYNNHGTIRDIVGDMIIATPGIRMSGELNNDHSRSGTPSQAVTSGADYLIVGRPIIHAENPRTQAEMFIAQIDA